MQDLNLKHTGDKEQMFDDFLVDLFTDNLKLDLEKMGLGAQRDSTMPLDKSLMLTTAKRQTMEKLLLTESHGGALSNLQLRHGSAAGLTAHDFSNTEQLGLKGASGPRQHFDQDFQPEIAPLQFDMGPEEA